MEGGAGPTGGWWKDSRGKWHPPQAQPQQPWPPIRPAEPSSESQQPPSTPPPGAPPPASGNFWSRRSAFGKAVIVAVVVLVLMGIIAAAVGGTSTHKSNTSGASKSASRKAGAPRQCSSYTGPTRPQSCIPGSGVACSHYAPSARPAECFTPAQRRARALQAKRQARIAKARARAAAKARARAAAQAAARAKARAAAIAAANAWHMGYYRQDDNVYWRWVHGRSCKDFAENGCWHIEVITRYGCQSYVGVEANEYQGSSIIGDLLDNNGNGIPPKTPEMFELDADAGATNASDVNITCD